MIYSISYDLRQPGRNYDGLYEIIKSAPGYSHPMDSLWFISTSESVDAWSDRLLQAIDHDDILFVVDITGQNWAGWMSKATWEWLSQHNHVGAYAL